MKPGHAAAQGVVNIGNTLLRWIDSGSPETGTSGHGIDWLRTLPYVLMHLACLTVFLVGWSAVAIGVCAALYLIRMFAITGFYHRYFSHRSFKTSRAIQFLFAVLGASAVQRGPIWWAAHHRHHHARAESEDDPHSPARHGFWRSHTGWFLTREHFSVRSERAREWLRYPELCWLDRFDVLVPVLLAIGLLGLGAWLERYFPELGTNGPQMLVWGFCISTVFTWHATFSINSLAHRWGSRRYATDDDSRNNLFLALLTLGEGWHNNHHHYPASARQGFFWWEIDITWYGLKLMETLGLVRELRPVPIARRDAKRGCSERREQSN